MRRRIWVNYLTIFCLAILAFVDVEHTQAQSNEGHEFYFSFLEHIDQGTNSMVAIITSRSNTQGLIEAPALGFSRTFTTIPGETTIIDLPRAAETVGSERVQNNGLRILAQDPISVYIHQYSGMRSEASLVLPVESLGDEYFVMSYDGVSGGFGGGNQGVNPSEFLVLGTQEETMVSIELSADTEGGRSSGQTINVMLDAGQTYQVQGRDAIDDLTGSYIRSDKPVAVFSGNSWTSVPNSCTFRDNLLEQMYAVGTWGKMYVAAPSAHLSFNVYRVIAAEDGTQIEIISNTPNTINLNRGAFYEFQLRGEGAYIESNRPILVAQYIPGESCNGHNIGDPSMLLLNSIEQYRDTVTLYNSSFENITQNYINAVIKTEDIDITFLDGELMRDQAIFSGTLGRNDEFTYLTANVGIGAHNLISLGCGVIASSYGYGPIESYAYGGGASFARVNSNPIPEGGCLNDTVFFNTGLNPFQHEFLWDLGDGSFSTEASFEHFYPELGSYDLSLIIKNICLGTVDTLYRDFEITLRTAVEAIPDTMVCEGETVRLGATDVDRAGYIWTGPENYFSEEQFPHFENIPASASGTYAVVGVVSGCATFPAFMDVEVIPTPNPMFDVDTFFCSRNGSVIFEVGDFIGYEWSDGSSFPVYETDNEGTYWVNVTDDFGCVGSDSINIYDRCPTKLFIPNAFSPNNDGINDRLELFGNDVSKVLFQVFDRWGNLIFESTDLAKLWDGTNNGELAPAGVYVWKIIYDGVAKNRSIEQFQEYGSVTLIR